MDRFFAILFLLGLFPATDAQTLANGKIWRYQLLDGSAIMDECPICGRPTYLIPLNGSFDLVGTSNSAFLQITNIVFASGYTNNPDYTVTGSGTLDFSKSVPEFTADITIRYLETLEKIHLTNEPPDGPRIFPMLSVIAGESPSTLIRKYHLQIKAAPIREVWFSTAAPFDDLSPGDLLSTANRVVKKNSELTDRLSLVEPADISLDALDVGPRGEIFFSSVTTAESFVNGTIGHGDIITSGGRVYLQNSQLLAPFGVDDPEAGLDALHIKSEDEIYFSISKEVTRLNGSKLRRGDILSSKGQIFRTEANLLLRYQNPFTNSVGIDALHIWPNGEIWFSTETNFDSAIGPIDAGDILSDQGYIAIRNADLIAVFKPSGTNNVGLDAMTIISDASASSASNQILEIFYTPEGIDLRWESQARLFQLEKALSIEGPWTPITPIIIERTYHDASLQFAAFYRVRQW